jgi:hypothetical protein
MQKMTRDFRMIIAGADGGIKQKLRMFNGNVKVRYKLQYSWQQYF